MTRAAWFCPACQKHHAPHVETCPVESADPWGLRYLPQFTPSHLSSPTKPSCKVCGIIFDGPMGYVCPNINCQSGFATMAMTTQARATQ